MFRRSYRARCVRALKTKSWKRLPMKLIKWKRKMPSQQYDLVPNDEYDTRIPLHPEEAFHYGITFQAKYIGTMDVPRPTSRVEIVAAMRRVRYEFKAKGVKKRKVTVDVSTDGVRVTASKKKIRKKSSKLFRRRRGSVTTESVVLLHHPIYRIFYVSHDSSDLKIFSYIARDGATNVFKCNVFKSNRKSQAMRIVRTVGQAFEVCHKIQGNNPEAAAASTSSAVEEAAPVDPVNEIKVTKEVSECGASDYAASTTRVVAEGREVKEEQNRPQQLELLPPPPRKDGRRSPQRSIPAPNLMFPELPECVTKIEVTSFEDNGKGSTPLSAQHNVQLLHERLEQQAQQTRAAVAQLLLLRDQLAAEQSARCEAQARTHQLLVHNKELLEHIAALVAHLQERERGSTRPINAQQLTLLPQAEEISNSAGTKDKVGNQKPINNDALVELIAQSKKITQNVENNNIRLSPFGIAPVTSQTANGAISAPCFNSMTNEQTQAYLISKFEAMGRINGKESSTINNNQQFFQNSNAFPNIPPLTNHYSNEDISNLLNHNTFKQVDQDLQLAQAMGLALSENSLGSSSQDTTSKDSTPDAFSSDECMPFIMPLSHNGTLTATGEDGRVRLIVPVSPSPSSTNVAEGKADVEVHAPPKPKDPAGASLAPPASITRTTSEKVPNRSEMMTALRSQWTRHTTK